MSDNIQEVLDGCLLFSVKRLDRALDKFTEEALEKSECHIPMLSFFLF